MDESIVSQEDNSINHNDNSIKDKSHECSHLAELIIIGDE